MIANPPYGKDWKRDQDAVRGRSELLHRLAPAARPDTENAGVVPAI